MDVLFPAWSNTAFRVAMLLVAFGVVGVPLALIVYVRTPYSTGQGFVIDQPVEFDHRHHGKDAGIPCLYCHGGAERAANAGVPSVSVCMGCHSQVWLESPLLLPVRSAFFTGTPIRWNRVHDLPDFVYFNHAIHVTSGVSCANCHGKVEDMARVYQVAPLTMGWCLECHREPSRFFTPTRPVETRTHCTACHR